MWHHAKKATDFLLSPVAIPIEGLFHSESGLGYLTYFIEWDSDKCEKFLKSSSILAAVGIQWAPYGMPEIASYGMRDMWPCDPCYSLPIASKYSTCEWSHLGHPAARRSRSKVVL